MLRALYSQLLIMGFTHLLSRMLAASGADIRAGESTLLEPPSNSAEPISEEAAPQSKFATLEASVPDVAMNNPGLATIPPDCTATRNSDFEAQMLDLINKARAEAKLATLKLNDKLTRAAVSHGLDLACNGEKITSPMGHKGRGHVGSNGSTIGQRGGAVGYPGAEPPRNPYPMVGEILAYGHGDPKGAVEAWMKSNMGHKENMLDPRWTEIGVAHVNRVGSIYTRYWVVVFGNPNPASLKPPAPPPAPGSFASGVSGNPALVRVLAGPQTSQEVVVPLATGGLGHFSRVETAKQWSGPTIFAKNEGQVGGVAMVQGMVDRGNNFEVVARIGDRLAHLWRDNTAGKWIDTPTYFATGVSGVPSLVESTPGIGQSLPGLSDEYGTLDVVVPLAAGGLAHFWRNNTTTSTIPYTWSKPIPFAQSEGQFEAAALVQKRRWGEKMFEVVARIGDRLAYFWRDKTGPNSPWNGPTYFATGVSGNPALTENVAKGVDLVVPLVGGGMAHFKHYGVGQAWDGPTPFAQGVGQVDAVALTFKDADTLRDPLQVVARMGERLAYFECDSSGTWSGPIA